jgi:hypothetical protein
MRRVSSSVRARGDLAEALEEIGEDGVGVQWHVAEHVMEDVRFREIVELVHRPNRDGRRKNPLCQAVEELVGGDEAANRLGAPPCALREDPVHVMEIGHGILTQSDGVGAIEEQPAAEFLELLHAASIQDRPHRMLIRGVCSMILHGEYIREWCSDDSRHGRPRPL